MLVGPPFERQRQQNSRAAPTEVDGCDRQRTRPEGSRGAYLAPPGFDLVCPRRERDLGTNGSADMCQDMFN